MKKARKPTTAWKQKRDQVEGEAEERQRLGRKEKLRKKTQTAQGNTTEPRPHTAVISFIPILLLSLRTSNCIGVNIQPPATLSNNPKT